MELNDDAPADPRGRDVQAAPAPLPRGQPASSTCSPGSPTPPEVDDGPHVPDQPDLDLGPARPGADHAAGGRPRRPPDLPEAVRRRARSSTAAPRASASSTGPRPAPTSTRPRSTRRCSAPSRRPRGPRPQPRLASSAGSTRTRPALQDLVTNLRIVTGSFAAAGPGARAQAIARAARAARGRPGRRSPTSTPSFPPLRAFAREALPGVRSTPGDARRRDAVHRPAARRWSRSRSCAACARTCARRSPTSPAHAADDPVPGAGPRALDLLQQGRHPVVATRGRPIRQRPYRRPSRIGDGLPGDRATGSPGSPARAAPATPTASTSGSRRAAARTRSRSPDRCRTAEVSGSS